VIGLDVALLGLILAIYAIIYSIQDEAYLSMLIASRNYQYLLFQTTWTSYWIFSSIALFGFLEVVYYNVIILAFALFTIIYGLLGTFILITKALRKIAVTAARKNDKLTKSWEEGEKK
jgi:predicted membrane protein